MPELVAAEQPVDHDEPVAVLTYARMRFRTAHHFLKASQAATAQVIANPALVDGFGLSQPPRTVGTFSLWRSAAAMRSYAYGADGPAHVAAMRGMHEEGWHLEWLFARFRPYAAQGEWDGREPVSAECTPARVTA
jgi:hypothetical protein